MDDGTRQAHMKKTRKMISMINTLILSSDILYVSGKTFVNLFKKTVHRKIESDIIKPKQENKKAEPDLQTTNQTGQLLCNHKGYGNIISHHPPFVYAKGGFFYGELCKRIYDAS